MIIMVATVLVLVFFLPLAVWCVLSMSEADREVNNLVNEDRLGPTLNPPGSDTIEFLIGEGERTIGPVNEREAS